MEYLLVTARATAPVWCREGDYGGQEQKEWLVSEIIKCMPRVELLATEKESDYNNF